jgi:hypothetical protein
MLFITHQLISGLLEKANSYLDPSSGSFLLQLIIAAAAGIGLTIATQWTKIKNKLKRKKEIPSVEENVDKESGDE